MRKVLIVLAGAAALGVTACSGSGSAGVDTGSGGGGSSPSAAAATASAAPDAASSSSSVATSLDPCQLVTSSEASALAGATFGAGREEKTKGGGRICVYGYQTTNVFTVEVGQDKSTSDAQKQWSKNEAKARSLLQRKVPAGFSVHVQTADVSGLGDRAATVYSKDNIAGHKFGISGIYLLKGATFVAFQDLLLGSSPPSTSALQAQARTTLSRVS
jgi:Protein of unknown function (DUF3558)